MMVNRLGQRWAGELIVRNEWRTRTISDYMNEILGILEE